MRILIALPLALPLVALAACQVSKGNNEVSVSYNQEVAANTAADVGNTVENAANDIGNDVKNTGEKIQNKVGNVDVDVKVGKDVKTENKAEKK
jgi:hypothetical protein